MAEAQSNRTFALLTNDFGIYVHIPFCVHKCSYCDFYSLPKTHPRDYEELTQALLGELREASVWFKEKGLQLAPLKSLFFGGGTPSLMPVPLLGRICEAVFEFFPTQRKVEVTLEANPETVDKKLCRGLIERTPINRVSLGAQSFHEQTLKKLERLGSVETTRKAVHLLRSHGFENLNLDLISGIPGRGVDDFLGDVRMAETLEPKHISFYALSLKPSHPLYSHLPEDEQAAEIYERGTRLLETFGYSQYEISNFSKSGFRCQHNLLYWSGGDFLGVGPSAASRFFWNGVFHHRKQVSDLQKYLEKNRFTDVELESSTAAQTVLEAVFLELRQNDGIGFEAFSHRYSYDLRHAKKFPLLLDEGLIEVVDERLRFTPRGRLLADTVTSELVDF